jgi:valyl-tRNA synthetase
LMNLEGVDPVEFNPDKMDITDKWILSRLAKTIVEVTESLDKFKYSEPLSSLYRFFWNDFCDWYLEWAKPRMQDERKKPIAQNVLAFVLDHTLRLLHPFVPFITEGIFQKLNEIAPVRKLEGLAVSKEAEALVIAQWPEKLDHLVNNNVEKRVSTDQSVVRAVRDIKGLSITPSPAIVTASVNAPTVLISDLQDDADLISHMAGIKKFTTGHNIEKPKNAATAIVDDMQIYVHNAIDPEAERTRLEKQKQQLEKAKKAVEAKLANENFVTKAKPEVVAQAGDRLTELLEQLKTVEKHLSELYNSG